MFADVVPGVDFNNPVLQPGPKGDWVFSKYFQRILSQIFGTRSEATAESGPFTYLIPYAAHIPAVGTGPDGNGSPQDGNHRPLQDLLIGLTNWEATTQNVRFRFFNGDGTPALWGNGAAYRDYSLGPGHSVATTLIPTNIFVDPPQNFVGYAKLETAVNMSAYGLLGGGGFYPAHWNNFSLEVPIYKTLSQKSSWRFGYLIPYFDDYNHSGASGYRTELVITNFDTVSASFWVTFSVADFYGAPGTVFRAKQTVAAGHSISVDLYTLLQTAGYPAGLNSEGSLLIEAHASDTSQTLINVKACPFLMIWNRDKNLFSAGQPFWD